MDNRAAVWETKAVERRVIRWCFLFMLLAQMVLMFLATLDRNLPAQLVVWIATFLSIAYTLRVIRLREQARG